MHGQAWRINPTGQYATRPGPGQYFVGVAVLPHAGDEQRFEVGPTKAWHGGAQQGCGQRLAQRAVCIKLAHPLALVHGEPIVAQCVDRGAIGTTKVAIGRVGVEVNLPVVGFGVELGKQGLLRQAGVGAIKLPAPDAVTGGVGPIKLVACGAPGQAVGGGDLQGQGVGYLCNLDCTSLARIDAPQTGIVKLARLVDGANPKASLRITFAIIGAHDSGVTGQRGDQAQRCTPVVGPENPMAQRQHQAALLRGCDTAWRTGHVPAFSATGLRVASEHLLASDVNPVKQLFLRVPKGRFTQGANVLKSALPSCWVCGCCHGASVGFVLCLPVNGAGPVLAAKKPP